MSTKLIRSLVERETKENQDSAQNSMRLRKRERERECVLRFLILRREYDAKREEMPLSLLFAQRLG